MNKMGEQRRDNSVSVVHPSLRFNLPDEQCKRIIEGALKLLTSKGVQSKSRTVQHFLSANPGIWVSENRVYFREELLQDYINQMQTSYRPEKREEHFHQRPPWSSLNIADAKSGTIRVATENDLIRALKLYEGLGIYGGVPPVVVGTVEPRWRDLFSTKVCLQNSKSFGGPMDRPNEEDLDAFARMFEVVGRKPDLLLELIVNPLQFNDRNLEFFLRHREERKVNIIPGAGMSCCGSTAPLMFPAAFSLAFAEGLAASIFSHLCTGKYPLAGANLGLLDFRYTTYVVGSPEWSLLDMVSRELFRYITGSVSQRGALLSSACWPDAHAAHDHTMSAILQGLQGARFFSGSGQLSHDEIFSPEIVVIDRDILGATERLVKGIKWEEDLDSVSKVIYEGLDRGHFLNHHTTLDKFRDFLFTGDVFQKMNLDQWRKFGSIPLLQRAWERIDDIVEEYDFRRPKNQIDELERIYQYATKE